MFMCKHDHLFDIEVLFYYQMAMYYIEYQATHSKLSVKCFVDSA